MGDAYCKQEQAEENFYLPMQIGHMVMQLLEKGSLPREQIVREIGSLWNLAMRLLEELRTGIFLSESGASLLDRRNQIRLDSS